MNYVDVKDQLVNIAQIVRRCPEITLRRAFGRAYRDWAQQTQYLRVAIPGQTTADVAQYDLGSDPYVEIVAVLAVMGSFTPAGGTIQYWTLSASDSGGWNPNVQPDTPISYCYVPQAQIAVFPTPDQVYGLTVTAIVQPKEDAAQVPEAGLTKYRAGIEAGALAYLLEIPGQAWSNPQGALIHRARYQSSINNGKAEVQRAFNTGSVRTRPRPFVIGGGMFR